MREISIPEQHKILDEIYYEQGILFEHFHPFVYIKTKNNTILVYIFNNIGELYGYGFCLPNDIYYDVKDRVYKNFEQICATKLYNTAESVPNPTEDKNLDTTQRKIKW
jgi:hypothetical protein